MGLQIGLQSREVLGEKLSFEGHRALGLEPQDEALDTMEETGQMYDLAKLLRSRKAPLGAVKEGLQQRQRGRGWALEMHTQSSQSHQPQYRDGIRLTKRQHLAKPERI